MTENNPITKIADGTVVHQVGEIFIDPNQPGDIAHIVRDLSLQIPDDKSVVYWARCSVNGHSHDIPNRGLEACTFINISIAEALATLPESRLCSVCFDPNYIKPVVEPYDPKNDPFTGWRE
jgi:hypothetical protein